MYKLNPFLVKNIIGIRITFNGMFLNLALYYRPTGIWMLKMGIHMMEVSREFIPSLFFGRSRCSFKTQSPLPKHSCMVSLRLQYLTYGGISSFSWKFTIPSNGYMARMQSCH